MALGRRLRWTWLTGGRWAMLRVALAVAVIRMPCLAALPAVAVPLRLLSRLG